MSYALEICAASLASAQAAQAGGANRIELCQNLEQGGITPSYGLVRQVLAHVHVPVFVLIRPRPGGFVYSPAELAIMRDDVEMCCTLGCAGVVLGVLDAAGRVDMAACRELLAAAGPLAVTFHRAFDACPDQAQALEDVIALGCQRLLTSGGQATAEAGQVQLAALVQQAAGRIRIMPGAGIAARNVRALAAGTGAHEFHASAKRSVPPEPAAGLFATARWETDATLVAELVAQLHEASTTTSGASTATSGVSTATSGASTTTSAVPETISAASTATSAASMPMPGASTATPATSAAIPGASAAMPSAAG